MIGVEVGNRFFAVETDLKRECRFCGYCGAKMKEILHPSPSFDRVTGKQGDVGSMHWECPKRGLGLQADLGDWVDQGYENNPHDSVYLREVTKENA